MLGIVYLASTLLIILYKNIFLPKEMDTVSRKRFLRFAFVVMVLLLGCRYPFAAEASDVENYYKMFERAGVMADFSAYRNRYESVEIGYLLFNWFLAKIISWPQFILFAHAIICCYLTLKFINRYSDDLQQAVGCFVAFGGLMFYSTAFRQAIAISLCLSSIKFIEEKKPVKFLALLFLAISIHNSSIVFLPAYFLVNNNITKKAIFTDIFMVVILVLSSRSLINMGNEFMDSSYGQVAYSGSFIGGAINLAIAALVIFLMYVGMPNKRRKNGPRQKRIGVELSEEILPIDFQFFHLLIIGTCIYALRFSALALERVSFYYFTPMLYILFPQVINVYLKKETNQFSRVVVFLLLAFLIIWRGREFDYVVFWGNEELI